MLELEGIPVLFLKYAKESRNPERETLFQPRHLNPATHRPVP